MKKWNTDNPIGLNESLLAMKAYAPFHHLYAISVIFAEVSDMSEMVPRPSKVIEKLKKCDMMETVVNIAGKTLNRAFKNANSKAVSENKVFSPQNWIKSKTSIITLTEALRVRLDAMEDDETNLGAKFKYAVSWRSKTLAQDGPLISTASLTEVKMQIMLTPGGKSLTSL